MYKKAAVVLLAIILPFVPLNADMDSFWENTNWAILGSLNYFAADNGPSADPAPIIPSLGFSFSWQFMDFLRLELTEDIYLSNYEFNTALGYPMACGAENRSAFVVGFLTSIQATGTFNIGSSGMLVRVYGGPTFDFRLVIQALGLHPNDLPDAQMQTEAIRNYFWGEGRWIMAVFGAGMDFPINQNFLIGFDLRAWLPAYKLWADDGKPVIDGWRFGIALRVTPRKN